MIFLTLPDFQTRVLDNVLSDMLRTPYSTLQTSGSTILDQEERLAISKVRAFTGHYYDIDAQLKDIGINRDDYLIILLLDIILYNLGSRLTPTQIPEISKTRYKSAIDDLVSIKAHTTPTNWRILEKSVEKSSEYRFGCNPDFNAIY